MSSENNHLPQKITPLDIGNGDLKTFEEKSSVQTSGQLNVSGNVLLPVEESTAITVSAVDFNNMTGIEALPVEEPTAITVNADDFIMASGNNLSLQTPMSPGSPPHVPAITQLDIASGDAKANEEKSPKLIAGKLIATGSEDLMDNGATPGSNDLMGKGPTPIAMDTGDFIMASGSNLTLQTPMSPGSPPHVLAITQLGIASGDARANAEKSPELVCGSEVFMDKEPTASVTSAANSIKASDDPIGEGPTASAMDAGDFIMELGKTFPFESPMSLDIDCIDVSDNDNPSDIERMPNATDARDYILPLQSSNNRPYVRTKLKRIFSELTPGTLNSSFQLRRQSFRASRQLQIGGPLPINFSLYRTFTPSSASSISLDSFQTSCPENHVSVPVVPLLKRYLSDDREIRKRRRYMTNEDIQKWLNDIPPGPYELSEDEDFYDDVD